MDIEEATAFGEAFCVRPPTNEEWMTRRDMVTGLSLKFYNSLGKNNPPDKFRVLERELERSYCSGAYLSTVILAAAIVEIFYADVNKVARDSLNESLEYIQDEIEKLRSKRNDIAHYLRAPDAISLKDYIHSKDDFEVLARQSVSLVYHVARAYVRLDPGTALKGTRRSV